MLAKNVILAISKHDTLKPLGIQFRPFANNVRDTKDHKWRSYKDGETCLPSTQFWGFEEQMDLARKRQALMVVMWLSPS